MQTDTIYQGLEQDPNGAMDIVGKIIRDAQVFGFIDEAETCTGWRMSAIQNLYDKVSDAWEPYAGLPSNLPDELREKHQRIYAAAIARAKSMGWSSEKDLIGYQ